MNLKIFAIILIFCASPWGHCAKKLNYCQTIEFDPGAFDRKTLETASKKIDCRFRPVPLLWKTKSTFNSAKLRLSPETPSLIAYLSRNALTGEYSFDEKEFDKARREWSFFRGKHLDAYAYEHEIKINRRMGGEVSYCLVRFLDSAGRPEFLMQEISFFKEDKFSATYSSPIIRADDGKSLEFLQHVEKLFSSMEINW